MFNSSTMTKMVDEVVRDNDLPYVPRRIFEPPDAAWTWCCEFADPTASEPHRRFEVCVQWPSGADYDSVKAELSRQLLARVTARNK